MASNELLPPPSKRRHSSNLLLPCLFMALATSLALNAIFGGVILYARRNKGQLASTSDGWSKEAAEEAERVASIQCSGHGASFVDGPPAEGKGTVCECYGCFIGPDCSRLKTDGCVADSGNPLFLEPFWRKHASSSAVVVSGWHRMSYTYDDGSLIPLSSKTTFEKSMILLEMQLLKASSLCLVRVQHSFLMPQFMPYRR